MKNVVSELSNLTSDQVKKDLFTYIKRENLDLQVNFAFSRKTFSDFMLKQYGVTLSHFMVTEAILSCRGTEMDSSDPKNRYDLNKLIEWIMKNLPSLYSSNTLKSFRENKRQQQLEAQKEQQQYYESRFSSPNNKHHENVDDWFNNQNNLAGNA